MEGSKKIDISIIIRTFNEEEHIKTLLSRISIQKTRKQYEIIVVDSGSTDQTIEIIEEIASQQSIASTVLPVINKNAVITCCDVPWGKITMYEVK